jgi:hypothetical protein
MKPEQDAFGQGVWDHYHGERVIEIIERDDGHLGISGGAAVYFSPVEEWTENKTAVLPLIQGRILAESRNVHNTDKPEHLAFHARNRKLGRLPGQLRLRVRYKTMIGPWFDYLMVSPDEMTQIVEGTGWHIAQIIWAENGVDYTTVLEK